MTMMMMIEKRLCTGGNYRGSKTAESNKKDKTQFAWGIYCTASVCRGQMEEERRRKRIRVEILDDI